MSATLKLTHKAIGVEVRRGTFDVVLDGKRVGSVEMNDTIETRIEAGRHTLQVRNGRNSSRTVTFDAAEGDIVAFRCTGKRFLPLFLASFVAPRLALVLRREKPTMRRWLHDTTNAVHNENPAHAGTYPPCSWSRPAISTSVSPSVYRRRATEEQFGYRCAK